MTKRKSRRVRDPHSTRVVHHADDRIGTVVWDTTDDHTAGVPVAPWTMVICNFIKDHLHPIAVAHSIGVTMTLHVTTIKDHLVGMDTGPEDVGVVAEGAEEAEVPDVTIRRR